MARQGRGKGAQPPRRLPVGGLLVIAGCGLLVLANNAGWLPEGLRQALVLRLEGGTARRASAAEPGTSMRAAPTKPQLPVTPRIEPRHDAPVPEPDPAAARERPAPRRTAPRLAPETARPEPPVPAVEPPPLADTVERTPQPEPAIAPEPAPAPPPPGCLTPDQRRLRLLGLNLPDGFTTEWAGGPAVLRVQANELERGRTAGGHLALTFDGCFDASRVPALLKALRDQGVTATFFLTGIYARKFPDSVRAIAAAGHEIASHTDTHPHLTQLSDKGVLKEVETAEKALVALAGASFKPYLRPPFGDRDTRVLRLLIHQGYLPVYWTCDTLDWQTGSTVDKIVRRFERGGLKDGAIVLCHVGGEATASAVPQLVQRIRAAGLSPGPMSSVLRR